MVLSEDTILEKRYRIDFLLGKGGMGAIYCGFDTRLKRQVAIKENFFQTPQAIRQFEREALMLANLNHPNLPRVTDHFSFEGRQYLVMDFVEGQDLWEMVKQQGHPLAENQALDYIIQVCGAVQYLHKHDPPIIHRDIKPQNIKVTPKGRAVLVDFGIAKMVEDGEQTSTGARGVTPGFSPLEQYSGSGTSPVSDVYSLGATLYAVLTGQKPPDSASRMVNQAKFVPPAKLNADLSERVSQAIEYAMQPQPADRPPSVEIWRQELEAIRDETIPISVDKADRVDEATVKAASAPGKISRIPPTPLLISGTVVVVLVIGIIVFFALSGNRDTVESMVVATSTPAIVTVSAEQGSSATATPDNQATVEAAVNATETKLAEERGAEVDNETMAAILTVTPTRTVETQLANTPIPEETATPTAISTDMSTSLKSYPVSLAQMANGMLEEGYKSPPLGKVQLGNILFDLPSGQNSITTQAEPLPDFPTTINLPVEIPAPKQINLLITGGNTFSQFLGQDIGSVRLHFAQGEPYIVPLVAGHNIREWKLLDDQTVSTTSSTQVTEVWRTESNFGGTGIIDLLTIDLPDSFQADTLVTIEIIDSSANTTGSLDPAINLLGVTVLGL